jgi:hypothetical protein
MLFKETFPKPARGQLEIIRTFAAGGGSAVITFTNGGVQGGTDVRSGRILLNGERIFPSKVFGIDGSVSKPVSVLAGVNTLELRLAGKPGGQVTLELTQGEDEPSVEFPTGTVFVANTGLDSPSCGAEKTDPCATIGQGVARAGEAGGPLVAVAGGVYVENIELTAGINVFGAYDQEFTRRDLISMRSIMRGDGSVPATVTASNVTAPTVFEGFVVLGPTPTGPSSNSIGIWVRNSSDALIIRNNTVFGGTGGRGLNGALGALGANGQAGGSGGNASLVAPLFGGVGGPPGGGLGGASGAPIFGTTNGSGSAGSSSVGSVGGLGGPGGVHGVKREITGCMHEVGAGSISGTDGGDGSDGSSGNGGLGGVLGTLSATGVWVPQSGGSGSNGGTGGGGGGGGAGAGAQSEAACGSSVVGPSGGGGGGAGGGGAGGTGGTGGGTSFGVYVFLTNPAGSKPDIRANEIYLGIGGSGGSGGNGGVGGQGASGGAGGLANILGSGTAGKGGAGGDGGHGGGGGGGSGGLSIGLFANFEHLAYTRENLVNSDTGGAGLGGSGGSSLGSAASPGGAGQVLDVWFLP